MRRPPFSFGPQTRFMWNPQNPYFAVTGNMMSFIAPPFERYMVRGTKDALPLMNDPAVAEMARLFMSQEAVHSRMHHRHAQALIAQYPGLAAIRPELDRRYNELYDSRPLKFHLAYGADIEATFTPLFNTLLRNRETLFESGDSSVASLLVWHFVEEIEHRSSAIRIYDEVVGEHWYRLRVARDVFAHIVECTNLIFDVFDEVVPEADRVVLTGRRGRGPAAWAEKARARLPIGLGGNGRPAIPGQLHGVPLADKVRMGYRLAASQMPWHSPDSEECPPFALHWFDEYDRGRDVADWYAPGPIAPTVLDTPECR